MNALILAAGYATRLYPLTKDFPKPLLEVGDRTILDYLVDDLEAIRDIRRIVLVTNRRFLPFFEKWREGRNDGCRVELLDDGTTTNEDRLGAIGDLAFALEHAGLQGDLLVSAADNIHRFSLAEFVAAFQARRECQLCVHWVEDPQRLRRTGVVLLDDEQRVLEFAEKPAEPRSHWAVPPLYIFPGAIHSQVTRYLAQEGSPEAPGNFIQWLCRVAPVRAFPVKGAILDIGTPESLAAARSLLAGKTGNGQALTN